MDSVLRILAAWESEGIIIAVVLAAIVVAHYATKLWSSPADLALALMLAASLTLTLGALWLMRYLGIEFLSTRGFCCVVLYAWSVLGMLFFTARNTSRFKLCLGLLSQAGIVYALFVLI